jgi:hypothetical protein
VIKRSLQWGLLRDKFRVWIRNVLGHGTASQTNEGQILVDPTARDTRISSISDEKIRRIVLEKIKLIIVLSTR